VRCAVEMGSGAMVCIAGFMGTGSGVQKFMRRDTQTHRRKCDLMGLLLCCQKKESGLTNFVFNQCLTHAHPINYRPH
jgi:hypothetical protein